MFDDDPLWKQILVPYELRNRARINNTASTAGQAAALAEASQTQLRVANERIASLEGRLLGLGLYTRTILQLLVDKGVLTEDEFAVRLRELDLLDGKLDGK